MTRQLTDNSFNDETLREYFREDVLDMLKWLSQSGDPAVIHRVRRALKRSRALIQILQPRTEQTTYRQQLDPFRDVGRRLATTRDSHVLKNTWQLVCSETGFDESAIPNTVLSFEQPDKELDTRELDETIRHLLAILFVVPDWHFPKLSRKKIYRRIVRFFEKGRQRYFFCRDFPDVSEGFHDLRKSVKQWYYHTKYLSYFWKRQRPLSKCLKKLEAELGVAHDLYVLERFLKSNITDAAPPVDLTLAFEFIRDRQSQLEASSLKRAKDLYDFPAKGFVKRHLKN